MSALPPKYSDIAEVPPDPYDISAPLAHKLIGYYTIALTKEEQSAYDYAMEHSDMEGPCCCKCWRWKVYGGLGKYLIRTRQYTGQQLVDLWGLILKRKAGYIHLMQLNVSPERKTSALGSCQHGWADIDADDLGFGRVKLNISTGSNARIQHSSLEPWKSKGRILR